MTKATYDLLEKYMISCMEDSAHDKEHINRVLYNALRIAKIESNVDYDVLIATCLLHDIGRKEQFGNAQLCHAIVGSEKLDVIGTIGIARTLIYKGLLFLIICMKK